MEKLKNKKRNSQWEDYMLDLIVKNTDHEVKREFRFHDTRRWRFDAAIPSLMLAFECEGGSWTGGRHTNPIGFAKDLEKYNTATLMGWRVYRFVPKMLNLGWIEKILEKN